MDKHTVHDDSIFEVFTKTVQERYDIGLQTDDLRAMQEASVGLCLVHLKLQNYALAERWAEEFWRLLREQKEEQMRKTAKDSPEEEVEEQEEP